MAGLQRAPKPKNRVWTLYINDKKQDWQEICVRNKLLVKPSDTISWKYEISEDGAGTPTR